MVFLNGKLLPLEQASVPVLDRGFIFGDGVYELVPVYSRVPFRLDEHLERLERSLAAVAIRNPYSRAQWRSHVYALVDAQPWEDQGVYFQVTRGVAKRDHAFPKDAEPTVFMMANPLVNPPRSQVEAGAAGVSAQDFRWLRCDIKSISLIGNVLLRQLSAQAGAAVHRVLEHPDNELGSPGTVKFRIDGPFEAQSTVIDLMNTAPELESLTMDSDIPGTSTITLEWATGSTADFTPTTWQSLGSGFIASRYVKFRVNLDNDNNTTPAQIRSIELDYTGHIQDKFNFTSGCGLVGDGGVTSDRGIFVLLLCLLFPLALALGARLILSSSLRRRIRN